MPPETLTLIDFLLARIAEDKVAAQAVEHWNPQAVLNGQPLGPKLLAECEAKRRIVEAIDAGNPVDEWMSALTLEWVTKVLAAVYADHPDYRDEWRP